MKEQCILTRIKGYSPIESDGELLVGVEPAVSLPRKKSIAEDTALEMLEKCQECPLLIACNPEPIILRINGNGTFVAAIKPSDHPVVVQAIEDGYIQSIEILQENLSQRFSEP